MSNAATGWVWEHSPYQGPTFIIHLAIADVVNDLYGNEFWMSQRALAEKARTTRETCNRALQRMVDEGYLEYLESPDWGKRNTVRYRFLMPGDPVTEDHTPVTEDHTPLLSGITPPVTEDHTRNQSEPKVDTKGNKPPALSTESAPEGQLFPLEKAPDKPAQRREPKVSAEARELTQAIWDQRDPKPSGKFVAVAAIIHRLLEAGWPGDEVKAAGVMTPAFTLNAMEFTLNRMRAPARQGTGNGKLYGDARAEDLIRWRFSEEDDDVTFDFAGVLDVGEARKELTP